jgi:tetratricopeptide (TPR) repeat protein
VTRNPTADARVRSLRQGETFRRQGLLSCAIAEYARAVETDPRDVVAAAALGDLLLRAGDVGRAVELYARIADTLRARGGLRTAAALYGKILKLTPDAESVQIKAADVSIAQGMPAEARKILESVADRRASAGNRRGTAEMRQRIADLAPDDLDAGLAAAMAAGEAGDTAIASERLVSLSGEFRQRGNLAESLRALAAAAGYEPGDVGVNALLVALCLETGDLDRAARHATTAAHFRTIAAALAEANRSADAIAAWRRTLECDPQDRDSRLRLVREAVAIGDICLAREHLSAESDDADLLLCLAEVEMLAGDTAAVRLVAERVGKTDSARRPEMVRLGLRLSDRVPDAAFEWIDAVTDQAVAERDWPGAAGALLDYATRVSPHVPALMKLVEVCVDGELEPNIRDAQARLADAYLLEGRAAEARTIAEDLLIREPETAAHVERFRRTLAMLGEPDPDARVAERLQADRLDSLFDPPTPSPKRDALAVDLASAFRDAEAPGPASAEPSAARKADGRGARPQASRASAGAQHYEHGVALCKAGRTEEAMAALREALRSPRHRFQSATLLGRLHKNRGSLLDAIEWFERAIHAAPGPEATRQVLYELGRVLVSAGEGDRALAVFLELETDAPGYKDVARQLQHLSRKRAGG